MTRTPPPLRTVRLPKTGRVAYIRRLRLGDVPRVPLIGYLGMAERTGRREQSYRKLATERRGLPDDLPQPVAQVARLDGGGRTAVLFNRTQILAWLIRTGRLHPDGVTPLRRPLPGAGKRRLAA